jgi:hypothetical protein
MDSEKSRQARRRAISVDRANDAPARQSPALDDAAAILERIASDEAAADVLRDEVRRIGLPSVPADAIVGPLLRAAEGVVAVRTGVRASNGHAPDRLGRLYLTTERLLLVGSDRLELELGAVDELSIAGERLLVALRGGEGIRLDVARPRELRVLISGALASVRG